jgi:hypothetical protein
VSRQVEAGNERQNTVEHATLSGQHRDSRRNHGLGIRASFSVPGISALCVPAHYIRHFSLRLSRSQNPALSGIKQASRNTALLVLNYFNKINNL